MVERGTCGIEGEFIPPRRRLSKKRTRELTSLPFFLSIPSSRYVVASTKTPSASSLLASSSDSRKEPLNNPASTAEPSVYLGIFPANFIHVREELNDAEGRLSMVWDELHNPQQPISSDLGSGVGKGKGKARKKRQMEALAEEEEEEDGEDSTRRRREEETDADESRRPSWNTEEEERKRPREKVPPPIPSLKAGDETVSGATEALVDEIATALREWYSVSPNTPFLSLALLARGKAT